MTSTVFFSAQITEFAVGILFFLLALLWIGLVWGRGTVPMKYKPGPGTFTMTDEKDEGFSWIIIKMQVTILITALVLTTIGAILAWRPDSAIFTATGSLPFGFTECDESLTNDGFCAVVWRPVFYAIVFPLVGLSWGYLLNVTSRTNITLTMSYIFFAIGLIVQNLSGDEVLENLGITLSLLAGIVGTGAHIAIVVVSSIPEKDPKNDKTGGTFEHRGFLIEGNHRFTLGKFVVHLRRNWMTSEFWLNIVFGMFFFIFYWVIYYLGTSARNLITIGDEQWGYVAFDIVFIMIGGLAKLYVFTAHSGRELQFLSHFVWGPGFLEKETNPTGSQFQSKNPNSLQFLINKGAHNDAMKNYI